MKTSLDHLPEGKRAQLAALVDLFREAAPLGLLVLFGSHARGDWVDDETRGRIEACSDLARLDRWLARALQAASAREAVDDGPP